MPCKQMLNIVVILSIIVLGSACEHLPVSSGDLDTIIVFADSSNWEEYGEALESHFGQNLLMPSAEKEFQLTWRSADKLPTYHSRKNLILMGVLNGQDPISKQVKKRLTPEIIDGIRKGDYFYIPQQDIWAQDQYVIYMIAPDRAAMIQRIYDLGELAYDDFKKSYFDRLKSQVFNRYENFNIPKYLQNNYPFTLRIQHDYRLVDESLEDRYIWLRRLNFESEIDRSIAVRWIPDSDSIRLTRSWMIAQRNQLGAMIFQGDVVNEHETTIEDVQFARRPAKRLEGTWKNPARIIGGPFRTIAFRDRESGLIFLIDFYVQAIGQRKKPFVDQLDVIVHTFKTAAEARLAAQKN